MWHGRVEAQDEKRGTGLAPATMAINKSPMVNQRHADLERNKTGLRDNKQNKEIVSNNIKATMHSKNSHAMWNCTPMKKRVRCKVVLPNILK